MIIESITILGLNCLNCQEKHKYVNLGLKSGTLWATCNIGTNTPEEAGMYFAWGETSGFTAEQVGNEEGKRPFTWEDYQWGNPDSGTLVTDALIDENNKLKPEYDAATANWGEGWRMPTKADFEELTANTTTAWTQVNGVNGMLFTSTANTNTLFFPAIGYAENGRVRGVGDIGNYWSVSLYGNVVSNAWRLNFRVGGCEVRTSGRCYGYSVRPVRKNPVSSI